MEKIEKKYKIRLFIVIILILAAIIYCRPKVIYKEMTMYSLEGESVHVILDISWHKFLFKPTELRGKIIVDGQTYISATDSSDTTGQFLRGLEYKLTGVKYWYLFRKDVIDHMDSFRNNVTVYQSKGKLDMFCLQRVNDSKYSIYFGPAKNIEEANLISDGF